MILLADKMILIADKMILLADKMILIADKYNSFLCYILKVLHDFCSIHWKR